MTMEPKLCLEKHFQQRQQKRAENQISDEYLLTFDFYSFRRRAEILQNCQGLEGDGTLRGVVGKIETNQYIWFPFLQPSNWSKQHKNCHWFTLYCPSVVEIFIFVAVKFCRTVKDVGVIIGEWSRRQNEDKPHMVPIFATTILIQLEHNNWYGIIPFCQKDPLLTLSWFVCRFVKDFHFFKCIVWCFITKTIQFSKPICHQWEVNQKSSKLTHSSIWHGYNLKAML